MSKHNVLTHAKKQRAYACVQEHRLAEAVELYQAICARDPRDAESWFMLGTVHGRLGDIAGAEQALRKALAVAPDFAPARLNLGQALELQGKLPEAEICYHRALALDPELADAHASLARLCAQRSALRDALAHYEAALRLEPRRAGVQLELGRLLQRLGRLADALPHLEQAVRLTPADAEACYALAGACLDTGRFDEALRLARDAQRLRPDFLAALALEAAVLLRRGDIEAARARLLPVLDRGLEAPELLLAYAQCCRDDEEMRDAARRLEALLAEAALDDLQRELAHFRLGTLYDALHDYRRAIVHFDAGNRLKPVQFDRAAWARHIDELIETYTAEAIARAPRAGNCSERPLFVVGMPRSGTTLVTQILASHPDIASVGELTDLGVLARELHSRLAATRAGARLTQLKREDCDALATRYLATLERIAPGARRAIDKMPENFLHLGLITLLFPVARVIHCVRDPLDTCLSCYFQDFGGDLPYAYDLGDLGYYYRHYRRLMAHWREAVQTPILEVRYEDLVDNTERVAREMLRFCGVKWDPRCLDFHRHADAAATASFMQVRQPIYRSSVGRWRHYEAQLAPLRRALAGE